MSLSNGTVVALGGVKPSSPNPAIHLSFDGDSAYPGGAHHHRLADDDDVPAAPTTLALCCAFLNIMKAKVNAHFPSVDVHPVASARSTTAPDATTQGTADTLAAEIVADFVFHNTEAGVHVNNDAVNTMVDSTGGGLLANLVTTCASIRTKWLAHILLTRGTLSFTDFVKAAAGIGEVEILGVVPCDCGLFVPEYYKGNDSLAVFVRSTGLNVAAGVNLSTTKFNVLVLCK
jgi:hypothetical protein